MKTISRLILSAILLGITLLLAAAAKFAPQFFFSFYSGFSAQLLRNIAQVTEKLPFSLWEILLVLLALWVIYTFIGVFRKHHSILRWLSGLVLGASVLIFAFVAFWGLNHYSPGIAEALSLEVRPYTEQELEQATAYYAGLANQYAPKVSRDENGCTVYPDFETLAEKAPEGYGVLSQKYAFFSPDDATVKKIISWPLFSRFGITGIFVCYTAESCVNPDTYTSWLPFTMCHELSHRQGVAAEDEANFCAYLACMANGSDDFAYSGAVGAFVYCSNALYDADRDAHDRIYSQLHPGVAADLHAANIHYAQYEGKVQDAATKVNDVYLKAFEEEDGVKSYGKAADLLIAWYLKNNA